MSDSTALQIATPVEAKAKALKIIESNPGCMSYVRPEDLDTAALFLPVVSVIKPTKEDFYPDIPKIGIMARPQLVNLIAEKAGVSVIRTETSKRGEWIWLAHVWGEKRQPDGSMRTEDASYEFDAEKRAEMDILAKPEWYPTPDKKRYHLLEVAKFGEQRAVTGAQHALIHKLAHVARSFKTADELMRGMIVCRIDRNVDGLLRDPEMRQAAIDHALGVSRQIYGPRDVTPPKAQLAAPEAAAPATADSDDFDEEPPVDQPPFAQPAAPAQPPPQPENPLTVMRKELAGLLEDKAVRARLDGWKNRTGQSSALDVASSVLADDNATVEALAKSLERARKAKGGQA